MPPQTGEKEKEEKSDHVKLKGLTKAVGGLSGKTEVEHNNTSYRTNQKQLVPNIFKKIPDLKWIAPVNKVVAE